MDDSLPSSWFLVVFLYQLQTGLSLSGNGRKEESLDSKGQCTGEEPGPEREQIVPQKITSSLAPLHEVARGTGGERVKT